MNGETITHRNRWIRKVVLEHASDVSDCAFLDDRDESIVDRVIVIGNTGYMVAFYPGYKLLFVTVGNNALRERRYKQVEERGYTFPNIIHLTAYVSSDIHIGSGCMIFNNGVGQNSAKCREGCFLNPGVELHHDNSNGFYCLVYTNSVVWSLTMVGNRV